MERLIPRIPGLTPHEKLIFLVANGGRVGCGVNEERQNGLSLSVPARVP